MSNNKQSSVEWLISQLQRSKDWHRVLNEISQMSSARIDIIEQAKAMEKEQKIEFANKYAESNSLYCSGEFAIEKGAEQYYNETFGGNNEDTNRQTN